MHKQITVKLRIKAKKGGKGQDKTGSRLSRSDSRVPSGRKVVLYKVIKVAEVPSGTGIRPVYTAAGTDDSIASSSIVKDLHSGTTQPLKLKGLK